MSDQGRTSTYARLFLVWVILSLAFAIYHSGGSVFSWRLPSEIVCGDAPERAFICGAFGEKLATAGLICGASLLLRALALRRAAHSRGLEVRAIASASWLGLSIALAPCGLFVAGPTASWNSAGLTRRQNGLIALAGPAVSMLLAALFFAVLSVIMLARIAAPPWFPYFGYVGFRFNALLALWSMVPVERFAGARVLAWSRGVFFSTAAAAFVLVFVLGDERVLAWLLRVVTSIEG